MAIFKKIKPEFEKLPLKKLFLTIIVISLVTVLFGLVSQIFLPPQIPLFFGLPQTKSQLAPSILIVLPSLISIFISLTNVFISIKIHDVYLKKVLAFSAITVSIMAAITTLKIIFLISSI